MFFLSKAPFSRFIVHDRSMLPNFSPGDHVLTFNWGLPKSGNVIVFEVKDAFYVKRVKKIKDNLIYVTGDNMKESSKIDPIDEGQITGKVIWKY